MSWIQQRLKMVGVNSGSSLTPGSTLPPLATVSATHLPPNTRLDMG